jgi:uncharacterized protein (DUF885 family)
VSGTFDDAVAAYLQEYFEERPSEASFFGLTEHDHRLSDPSATGHLRREAAAAEWRRRFEGFDLVSLTPAQQVDRSLLLARLGQRVATAGYESWRRNATAYLDNGVFDLFIHGTRPESDATTAAVDRLSLVPAQLKAARENLDPTLVDADLLRQWGIPNVEAQSSFMRHGLGELVQDEEARRRLESAGAEAALAYDAFATFLADLAERASGSFVFGEERYDAVLRIGEGFSFGARQVRQMGQEQMARLDDEMATLAEKIAGTPDWRQVVDSLRDDHPADMDDLLRCYREETARARQFVRDRGIVTLPEGEACAVLPAPLFLRAAAPVASYYPPSYFGPPTKGTFNVPFTPDGASAEEQEARLRSNSFFEIPGVTAHEAYPGHHLHYAASQGTNALRQVLGSDYMVEGWGLYVEKMMGSRATTPARRPSWANSACACSGPAAWWSTPASTWARCPPTRPPPSCRSAAASRARRPGARSCATARIPPRPRPT